MNCYNDLLHWIITQHCLNCQNFLLKMQIYKTLFRYVGIFFFRCKCFLCILLLEHAGARVMGYINFCAIKRLDHLHTYLYHRSPPEIGTSLLFSSAGMMCWCGRLFINIFTSSYLQFLSPELDLRNLVETLFTGFGCIFDTKVYLKVPRWKNEIRPVNLMGWYIFPFIVLKSKWMRLHII